MTTISIIIPTLNERSYIGELLATVAVQTFVAREVIIVDGHSNDGTHKTIEPFIRTLPITGICSGRGVSKQRNIGALRASGDILLFLDADVQLPPLFLQKVALEMRTRGIDIACARFIIHDPRHPADQLGAHIINKYQAVFERTKNPMASGFCIAVWHHWHARIGGFNTAYQHGEDHDYIRRGVMLGAKYRLLKSVRVHASARRYHQHGRLALLGKYAIAELNRVFFNYTYAPREKALYSFGGFSKIKSSK